MKLNRLLLLATIGAVAASSCTKLGDVLPQSGTMLASQVQETNTIVPSRASAAFSGMFTNIGKPDKMYATPDDWEFLMINFCNDLEGADAHIADNNYNWFSPCGELSSRSPNYRNPLIRYRAPYNMISDINTFIAGFPKDESTWTPETLNMIAQSRALRAYSYMLLVPSFQFGYSVAADKPCVPICSPTIEDFTHNPRATVKQVLDTVLTDLNYAVEKLAGASRTTKAYIDESVARAIRARVYLYMGEWQKALEDATAAAKGYSPKTIADLARPTFYDINEEDWIWGYDMTESTAQNDIYATTSSWLRSFSGDGYAAATQSTTCINTLLWNMIPESDVRKGWWIDANLKSPLIDDLTWPGCEGDVAHANDGGYAKLPFIPYTNVKFGCKTIGTTVNDEDMPLIRVEEMLLIKFECMQRLGQDGVGEMEKFIREYRDPEYNWSDKGLEPLDEIWFQRRVELWGEGFFIYDQKRLNKPLVRFHDETSNISPAFRFNLAADDPWLLLRFPQGEMNTNYDIVDNAGGHQPKTDEGKSLRDGVTD